MKDGGRDPERIDRILALLAEQWKRNPNYRLGQLISILSGGAREVFGTDDDEIEERLLFWRWADRDEP